MKDLAKIVPIEKVYTFHLVYQPIAEAIQYVELEQRLAMTAFDPKVNKTSKSDREEHIFRSLNESNTVKAALQHASSSCAFRDVNINVELNNKESCNALDVYHRRRQLRDSQCHDAEEVLADRFDLAVWLQNQSASQNDAIFNNATKWVDSNHFGDLDANETIRQIIEEGVATYHPDNKEFFNKEMKKLFGETRAMSLKKRLHPVMNKVKESAVEYVNCIRSYRFLESYRRVHEDLGHCGICRAPQKTVQQADFILLMCGHMSCRSHCSREECPVEGCNGTFAPNHLLSACGVRGVAAAPFFSQGEKMRQICDTINSLPKGDQALVFVVSDAQRKLATAAFKNSGITFLDIKSAKLLSTALNNFQYPTKTVSKVLILNIGDVSASGR